MSASEPEDGPEVASDLAPDEQAVLEALESPLWPLLPESVTVAPDVDLSALDPCDQGEEKDWRRCVGARRDGHRCNGRALDDALLCPFHDGRADPSLAAKASHAAKRERKEGLDQVAALRRLGTRQLVAEALVRHASDINAAIGVLARSAAAGDIRSAQALIPWLDQGLGKPTERVEVRAPSTLDDLEGMDTAALEAMVAHGRARRLRLVEEQEERAQEG